MFQMMNSARINTGVSGMSIAGTAYLNALAYTLQRRQGLGDHRQIKAMMCFLWNTLISVACCCG